MLKNYKALSFSSLTEQKYEEVPEHILCYHGDIPYTWRQIHASIGQLAKELSAKGVTKGTHVGIYGRNSINWVICFFAVQKVGAIGVLLNPALQTGELVSHIRIADITHLCYGESPVLDGAGDEERFLAGIQTAEGCSALTCTSIRDQRIFGTDPSQKREDAEGPDVFPCPEPDDPALMLFTSGSMGKPKCVLLSAYNVLIASYESAISQKLTPQDRTCLILPLFHIFGLVAGLFSNILADAVLYMPEDMHSGSLIDTICTYQCTVFHAVPTMMLMLLNNAAFTPAKLSSVRCSILSGAPATGKQFQYFRKELPNDHFLSSYGLSEAAPVSILPYGDSMENCICTVGKPMPHVQLKIISLETGKECAPLETGEIVVKGDNLMTGYYKVRIEEQAIDGRGWLHTGDLGYLREDGYLCLTGRIKELIVRGGENIMPHEVAQAIGELPCVEDVRVVGVPSDFYGEEVCACIRLKEGAVFEEAAVREQLKGRLARFKIPSWFLIYDAFPVLGTGKVDMAALKREAERRHA